MAGNDAWARSQRALSRSRTTLSGMMVAAQQCVSRDIISHRHIPPYLPFRARRRRRRCFRLRHGCLWTTATDAAGQSASCTANRRNLGDQASRALSWFLVERTQWPCRLVNEQFYTSLVRTHTAPKTTAKAKCVQQCVASTRSISQTDRPFFFFQIFGDLNSHNWKRYSCTATAPIVNESCGVSIRMSTMRPLHKKSQQMKKWFKPKQNVQMNIQQQNASCSVATYRLKREVVVVLARTKSVLKIYNYTISKIPNECNRKIMWLLFIPET